MTQQGRFARRTGVRRLIYSALVLVLIVRASLPAGILASSVVSVPDPSFDGDGIVTTDHDHFDQINDIVIQPDGKIVAAGHTGRSGELVNRLEMMVARYNSDGSLDGGFGSGGIVTTAFGGHADATSIALQPDGKIVIAGRTDVLRRSEFAVLRYNPDGSPDDSFGGGGLVITPIRVFAEINDLAIQSDGKIVVAGDATFTSAPKPNGGGTLVRYNTDGSRDDTFGDNGVTQARSADLPGSQTISPRSVAIQMDEKIVVAGACVGGSALRFCVTRYNADGSIDNTFDGDGLVITDFDFHSSAVAEGVSIQPDGRIIAAGHSSGSNGPVPVIARYNPDGSLDPTLNDVGTVITPHFVGFGVENLALQPDGKILLVGTESVVDPFRDPVPSVMALARYEPTGTLDFEFGSRGKLTMSIGDMDAGATSVAIQPDGRIVAGGFGNRMMDTVPAISDFALLRLGDEPPVVTITGPPSGSAFAVNTPVNFTGSFTDNPGETHSIAWLFQSLTQPGTFIVGSVFDAPPGSADTTQVFTEPGVYKVTLVVVGTVLAGVATTVNGVDAQVVIYDPNGGSVSGGGWINSPPRALVSSPDATGKANLAFVSQYQNGATVPTGVVEFRFSSLNFRSTGYEWLVVSHGRAWCKGTGTINGSGNYRFLLTSIDGQQAGGDGQDKFRIRIWSDTEGVIYDTQFDAPDTVNPTIALGGGSITIHH